MPPAPAALGALATLGVLVLLRSTRRLIARDASYRARLSITTPTDDTHLDSDGAVRSTQGAEIEMPEGLIDWTPATLERLARTYWAFLSAVTIGLIRVHYSSQERSICLLAPAFKLLTFRSPEYDFADRYGVVRWRIKRGVLVAARGRDRDGHLEIRLRRIDCRTPGYDRFEIEVEVANFYPALSGRSGRLGTWIYTNTQSRAHVLLTHAFLHRLTRRELSHSAVGKFRH